MPVGRTLTKLIFFKAGWLACLLLVSRDAPELALLAVAAIVIAHLAGVAVPAKEAAFLIAAALVGLGWESLLVQTGVLFYPDSSAADNIAPHWIVAMWMLFATTVNHGLKRIKGNWIVASLAGLVGGPLALYAGAGIGAVTFASTPLALVLVALGWAVLLAVLALAANTIIQSAVVEPPDDLHISPDAIAAFAGRQAHNA